MAQQLHLHNTQKLRTAWSCWCHDVETFSTSLEPVWGESIGQRWISPHKALVMLSFCYFTLDCSSCLTNGRVAGDLWSHAANVTTAMISWRWPVGHVGHCCGYISGTMMTSSNGNIYCVTGLLWGESTGERWIPLKKTSDAEFWCFHWSAPEKWLGKHSRRRWFRTPSRSLWRRYNVAKSWHPVKSSL